MLKKLVSLLVFFTSFQALVAVSPDDSFHRNIDVSGLDTNPAMQPPRVMVMSKKTYESIPETRYQPKLYMYE